MSTGSTRLSISTTRERWFLAALACLFVAVSVQYTIKAMANRSAIMRWREQIHRLGDENIYERFTYPNPPIMAMILAPIANMPALAGSLTWFYLKIGMTALAVFWVFRIIESPDRPFPPWAKAVAIILSLRPIIGDLSHGNVNLLILFLVVGALYAFHRGHDIWAGVILALAIACKVTPALFIPYWLWKREWKTLAGTVLGLVLFFLVVPGVYLGNERNLTLLRSWAHQMVTPFVVEGTVTSEHPNQSLPGLLFRLTTQSPSFLDEHGKPESYNNFLTLNTSTVKWIMKGCMAVFVLLVVLTCQTSTPPRYGWRLASELAIVVLGMLLFSERTWKHHCVTLLLPFSVICYFLAVGQATRAITWYLVGTLAAVMLLMASTSTSLLDFDAKLAQVYGAYVWAYLLLIAGLAVMLRQPRIATPTRDDSLSSR